jgi:hypothetical protein
VKYRNKGSELRLRALLFAGLLSLKMMALARENVNWKLLLVCMGVGGFGAASAHAQAMPASITGSWRIVKILPTHNTQCWDAERAKTLVGSTLKYRQGAMTWQGGEVDIPEALSRDLSRRKFQDEYKIDLGELGIHTESVTEIDLQHEDADITGATTEVPGDTVVLAGPGRIVVSACGVFYEAVRSRAGAR